MIHDIRLFSQMKPDQFSNSYLMGRSRTIGADNEMAGPPGGPSNEIDIGMNSE